MNNTKTRTDIIHAIRTAIGESLGYGRTVFVDLHTNPERIRRALVNSHIVYNNMFRSVGAGICIDGTDDDGAPWAVTIYHA